MSDANLRRLRGELPFPDAGEGVVLRFNNVDCEEMQKKFGDDWMQDAVVRCNRVDMPYLRHAIAVGGKKDGQRFRIGFDELDCPVSVIAEAVLDAMFLAMHGRTFEDHLDHLDAIKLKTLAEKKDEDQGNASSPEAS